MLSIIGFLILYIPVISTLDYVCPQSCSCSTFSPTITDKVQAVCNIAYVEPEMNFQVIPGAHTTRLTLVCEPYYVSVFSPYALSHLQDLEELLLLGCQFQKLPKELFELNTKLRILVVGTTGIQMDIPQGLFESLTQLESLTVYANLASVPRGELCKLKHLKHLQFEHNLFEDLQDIGIVHNGTDPCLPALQYLGLSSNQIKSLSGLHLQYEAPKLKEIYLNNNQMSNINYTESFGNLQHLEVLDLQHNQLNFVDGIAFEHLERFHSLRLGNNLIDQIDLDFFRDALDIEFLDLSFNLLTKLHKDIFHDCRSLQHLNISGNELRTIHANQFINQQELLSLNISHNMLQNISELALEGLIKLRDLDLSHNQLEAIGMNVWNSIPNLSLLSLETNMLTTVPIGLYVLTILIQLNLNYNRIGSFVPEHFAGLNSLQNLLLKGNGITYLPREAFSKMPKLVLVNLNDNKLSTIEYGAFLGTPELLYLTLNDNEITEIDVIFIVSLSKLQLLWLKGNKITEIHKNSFPSTLVQLDLSRNMITWIEGMSFAAMPKLEVVDLQNNHMESITTAALTIDTLNQVRPKFFLAYNPFSCTCRMTILKTTNSHGNKMRAFIADEDNLICKIYSGAHQFVTDLVEDDFLCEYVHECNSDSCECCFSLTDYCHCQHFCPDNCTCVHNINQERNIVNCSAQGYNAIVRELPQSAITLDWSANQLKMVHNNTFVLTPLAQVILLNNSFVQFIEVGAFSGLPFLHVLDISRNNLTEIFPGTFHELMNLNKLYLYSNNIQSISPATFDNLNRLQVLDLHDNEIAFIDFETVFPITSPPRLLLGNNPWDCSCEYGIYLKSRFAEASQFIEDINAATCANVDDDMIPDNWTIVDEIPIIKVDFTNCINISERTVFIEKLDIAERVSLGITMAFLLVISIGTGLVFYHRDIIQVWLYAKYGLRFSKVKEDTDKEYDAFVSFSQKDETFVVHELMPQLENGDIPFRLCVHYRDWPVGESISNNVAESVENSRRTILVLSDNFLESEWCNYEFQTAHHRVLKDKTRHLIVVLLQDEPPKDVDQDLQNYISTHTYLKYSDPWFWQKLIFALPKLSDEEIEHRRLNPTAVEQMLSMQRQAMSKMHLKFKDGALVEDSGA